MTSIATPHTEPLWLRARAMFARAINAVGAPVVIAAIAALSDTLRREIVGWLFPLEYIVRKLLIAEAAALVRAAPLPWTAGLQTGTCPAVKKKPASEDPRSKIDRANSETWPARFSFALYRASRPPDALSLRTPRVLQPAPFRLARRFEALRRVLENPQPYAQRMLQTLARKVRRHANIVRRAMLAGPRTDRRDPADPRLTIDAIGAAFDAPDIFEDTS